MPRVGFEPTIPVFERAKTFHALDCAATAIGYQHNTSLKSPLSLSMRHVIKTYEEVEV
jgi:formylmethanofuran dehydrogenase subunit E